MIRAEQRGTVERNFRSIARHGDAHVAGLGPKDARGVHARDDARWSDVRLVQVMGRSRRAVEASRSIVQVVDR